MTPSITFKLSKTTKRRMATMANVTERNEYKAAMIQAELAAGVSTKSTKEKTSRQYLSRMRTANLKNQMAIEK